nr:hypothetical protein [Sporosarcina globispora]
MADNTVVLKPSPYIL